MLVLTRKPGQSISIGDSIEIYVAEIQGEQVRLSIRAPRAVSVMRREIRDQIRDANKEASEAVPQVLQELTNLTGISLETPPAASPLRI